jgi:hypothetical protein
MEISIEGLRKLNRELPYEPVVIPFLGINTKEYESAYSRDVYISKFIAAVFTIAKLWNQPRCPSTDEQIKQIGSIFTMMYYSVIKSKIMPFVGICMEL